MVRVLSHANTPWSWESKKVKNLHLTQTTLELKEQCVLNLKKMLFKSSINYYSNDMKICFFNNIITVLKTCVGSPIL